MVMRSRLAWKIAIRAAALLKAGEDCPDENGGSMWNMWMVLSSRGTEFISETPTVRQRRVALGMEQ
jgi:hypothetical protein